MPFDDEVHPVRVVPYRPSWPAEFEALAERLRAVLGDVAAAIDHVGSTSVPGLAAKDMIDVQVRVARLDSAIWERMGAEGFRLRPEPWNRRESSFGETGDKMVFAPAPGSRAVNVHVRLAGGPNARYALLFRDYLRAHPAVRDLWGQFKTRLAQDVTDLAAYGQIKAPAMEIMMRGAIRWAEETGWLPG